MTPTARTIKHMEAQGYVADVVERRITRYLKRDFLGCIDVIALKAGERPCFIQTTDRTNKSKRKAKIQRSDHFSVLLATGRVLLHGWHQKKDGT